MIRTQLSLGLFLDLYELTMAQAYWQRGHIAPATFSLFFRKYPPDRGHFAFAGVEDVLDYLEGFRFASADIESLRSLNRFDKGSLALRADQHKRASLVFNDSPTNGRPLQRP